MSGSQPPTPVGLFIPRFQRVLDELIEALENRWARIAETKFQNLRYAIQVPLLGEHTIPGFTNWRQRCSHYLLSHTSTASVDTAVLEQLAGELRKLHP